jgi:endonuclease YncB( thermonuclease family)
MARHLVHGLLVVAVAAASPPPHATASERGQVVAGRPSVVDGDTIEVHGRRIRLHGIDAPERGQTCERDGRAYRCGTEAARALDRLIGDRPVVCEVRDVDRYRRLVAMCRVGGMDLDAAMVREGWALAYRRYSMAYVDEEDAARHERRGMWAGTFTPPWEWRRARRGK